MQLTEGSIASLNQDYCLPSHWMYYTPSSWKALADVKKVHWKVIARRNRTRRSLRDRFSVKTPMTLILVMLLLLIGGIEPNPGPVGDANAPVDNPLTSASTSTASSVHTADTEVLQLYVRTTRHKNYWDLVVGSMHDMLSLYFTGTLIY